MFHFKHFSLYHENSALKISTDAVLLAASTPVSGVQSLLDIGCGCGVIAFCLAWKMQHGKEKETSRQEIIGIDIDKASVDEALKNLEFFPKKEGQHITFRQQRIQDFAQERQEKFDLIVSNPPFFVDSLKPNTAQKNVSKHNDSLPFEDLRDAVTQLLAPQGSFYLILPTNESNRFEQISNSHLSKTHQMLIQPTPSKPVNRLITRYSLSPLTLPCHTSTLCLRDTSGNMSDAYQQLTEEFLIK